MPYIPVLSAALCIAGTFLWLTISLRDITRHRTDLERADKQHTMYLVFHLKARDASEKARTQEQVDISMTIYHNVVQLYNLCLAKPQNIILSRIMGYDTIIEMEEL